MDTLINSKSLIKQRLAALRSVMQAQNIAALLVPSSDPHLSEYLPERWQARQWFSGFTGSVGTLIVTANQALLFADSRYWAQAEKELAGTGIELFKIPTGGSTLHMDWLSEHVAAGESVAVDRDVLSLTAHRSLLAVLSPRNIKLATDLDLVGMVWPERVGLPRAPVYEHAAPYAVQSRSTKLEATRAAMRSAGATHHFISTLDDISYLFNLRGSDVPYNPVFVAHALIDLHSATIFSAAGKISTELQAALAADGIKTADYAQAKAALAALPADARLLLDPRRISFGLKQAIAYPVKIIEQINPTTLAKSRKTAEQSDFVRATMEQDGAALCEFYAWFENALGKERITELTIDEKLSAQRAKRPGYISPSFATVAGFAANGALPHYRATEAAHLEIQGEGLLLIDSGGQYLGGTTDITRVWPIGSVTEEQKRDYTLVLKGMIALSRTSFPRGTKSPMLDAIARAPLWAEARDYGHGTGHGVGYFLNVHEGPQSISQSLPEPQTAMEPGMITSIEPGIYRPGQWGIRIENLVLNVPASTTEFGEFLKFETLTLCPIDTRCIEISLLNVDEIRWLNEYHAQVLQRLSRHVQGAALSWLQERTKAI
ncbi:MAG: aminopeptidase P family protein [Burkholderiaceae bacterium]|nr:aminopeptidase P family protein [Burkholderiaceae bacterium]